jgi:hypothetical protein
MKVTSVAFDLLWSQALVIFSPALYPFNREFANLVMIQFFDSPVQCDDGSIRVVRFKRIGKRRSKVWEMVVSIYVKYFIPAKTILQVRKWSIIELSNAAAGFLPMMLSF